MRLLAVKRSAKESEQLIAANARRAMLVLVVVVFETNALGKDGGRRTEGRGGRGGATGGTESGTGKKWYQVTVPRAFVGVKLTRLACVAFTMTTCAYDTTTGYEQVLYGDRTRRSRACRLYW